MCSSSLTTTGRLLMARIMEVASELTTELFGPRSPIPWWVWPALLIMIFWGLLVPDRESD